MYCGRHEGKKEAANRDCFCEEWEKCVEKIRAQERDNNLEI